MNAIRSLIIFAVISLLIACESNQVVPTMQDLEARFGWASPKDVAYLELLDNDSSEYLDLREALDNAFRSRPDFDKLCPALRELAAEYPNVPPVQLELARGLMMGCGAEGKPWKETWSEAEELIRKAIAVDPEYADSYVLLGYVLAHIASYINAENALLKAEELGTDNPWLQINFAILYNNNRLEDLTCERVEIIRSLNIKVPNAKEAMLKFATQCASSDEPVGDMIELYEERLQHNPDRAFTYGAYARYVLGATLDYERAAELSRAALERKNYGMARAYLAASYYTKWFLLKDDDTTRGDAEDAYLQADSVNATLKIVLCVLETSKKTLPVANAVKKRKEMEHKPCGH